MYVTASKSHRTERIKVLVQNLQYIWWLHIFAQLFSMVDPPRNKKNTVYSVSKAYVDFSNTKYNIKKSTFSLDPLYCLSYLQIYEKMSICRKQFEIWKFCRLYFIKIIGRSGLRPRPFPFDGTLQSQYAFVSFNKSSVWE